MSDDPIKGAAVAAKDSETGRRLAGRILGDGVLRQVLAGDKEGFLEALEAPTTSTVEAAIAELGTMPRELQMAMYARAEVITDALLAGAAQSVWRACERLGLEHPDELPPDVIALVAAALSVGQPSSLADEQEES